MKMSEIEKAADRQRLAEGAMKKNIARVRAEQDSWLNRYQINQPVTLTLANELTFPATVVSRHECKYTGPSYTVKWVGEDGKERMLKVVASRVKAKKLEKVKV